ncbi:substrate-binding domain-containing protein [Paracoccus kondratievae]|uniref:Sugar ABC transporter n=1 Tax=Paracoccus kondratievae TaxID=135740 RepID=A0AAD3P193_9RHOB|nr:MULTISPECIES: sugar ABC transporter substrate-binding protein [Paracoccus]QFQ88576.1 substrate-binding domain-containing protein [Paracoccus kondratievae]GLK65727.1 sugar ABC transporter [Paracoccus kondratievae]SMG19022.1 mannose-binding protein/fructose-binding protein/ribose-binding protein [Paracoccus sp. J56]
MKPILSTVAFLGLCAAFAASAGAAEISACLITKTDSNPFFAKMREGAVARAKEVGIELKTFAGKYDGDHEAQVAAIETCMFEGVKGILMSPNDSAAIVPLVEQARNAGILFITLDSPLDPVDAADATFGTDNFKAGELIGKWAAAQLGDKAAEARIGFLDLNASQVAVDYQRDQGFMSGFGIDVKDPRVIGDEDDSRIIGHAYTDGAEEGGRKAMETILQINPDVNVVHTINEPAAAGAYEALVAAGREKDVLLVSVDGGCPGVKNIAEGIIGATAQQYPMRMAQMGIDAIKEYAETGKKPELEPGKDFFDTGTTLITDKPVEGLESIDSAEGAKLCWG